MDIITDRWKRQFLECKDITLKGRVEPIVLKPEAPKNVETLIAKKTKRKNKKVK
ncbi:MAG: hypothetical protein JJV89_02020 [Desulfosarcina sp.]|nr:hypothetical protein [Desulfobacterales bacterium]